MGVDASMLLRGVSRKLATDDWLLEQSFQLCTTFGAHRFDLAEHRGNAAIVPTCTYYERGKPVRDGRFFFDMAGPGSPYVLDEPPNPTFAAGADEVLLEVKLDSRYYDIGYERGDIIFIISVAEWIETNIPGAAVYYGGDGTHMKPFDPQWREALKSHLYTRTGRHVQAFDDPAANDPHTPEPCRLCPHGTFKGKLTGSGSRYSAYFCSGCGLTFESRDGSPWKVER